jgi:DNA-binding transcriptional ArsR family regulator
MNNTAIYKAISDPTRRAILDQLRQGDRSVKELVELFPMTQQAVSQHLSALRRARVVRSRRLHRENRYKLAVEPLREVERWLASFRQLIDPAGHHWSIGSMPGIAAPPKRRRRN